MAKISPVSIKYMIYAKFTANGAIEKPDVIGALFGQTEGLLGHELEMRELQREGKIGRIDVTVHSDNGKTTGEIQVPSSLDKSETTIIAAAIETIERIGPTDAKIEIEKIEDVRGNKREYIIERAKKLLEKIGGSIESRDIENAVLESSRLSKLKEYGKEKLPSGDILGKEIIVVEGRADVINLIKNKITNVIGMNGTILPEAIKELSLDKEMILFVDGDRGGKLIAKNVINNAKISYVTVAPDGKEVEELTEKEILMCLRKKVSAEEFKKALERNKNNFKGRKRRVEGKIIREDYGTRKLEKKEIIKKIEEGELSEEERKQLKEVALDIEGTKKAVIFDSKLEIIKKCSSSNLLRVIPRINNIFAIVTDGKVTQPIIREAENSGCKYLAAKNFTYIDEETKMELMSF